MTKGLRLNLSGTGDITRVHPLLSGMVLSMRTPQPSEQVATVSHREWRQRRGRRTGGRQGRGRSLLDQSTKERIMSLLMGTPMRMPQPWPKGRERVMENGTRRPRWVAGVLKARLPVSVARRAQRQPPPCLYYVVEAEGTAGVAAASLCFQRVDTHRNSWLYTNREGIGNLQEHDIVVL